MEIKNALVFLILLTLSSFVAVCLPKYDQNKKADQALNVRGNLPNFFGKSLRGDSIKVAYLGGSITAQNGWRAYSLEGFKQRYPKAVILAKNGNVIKNPDDYKENNWYVGKILIDGNLLP